MAAPERKSIPELVALYEFEPNLRDVYVEGDHDRELLLWYLGRASLRQISVYEIDTVDVPRETCERYSLHVNNRSEVMALAFELAEQLPGPPMDQVMCVVDKDLDVIEWRWGAHPVLHGTDYAAMESYGFTVDVLGKVLPGFAPRLNVDVELVTAQLAEVLKQTFALRMVNSQERWCVRWLDFTRCCRLNESAVTFETEDYVERLLSAGGRVAEKHNFLDDFRETYNRLTGDRRRYVHGHDFPELVGWYIRQVAPASRCSTSEARRSVMFSVEFGELRSYTLFQSLEAMNA